MEVKSLKPRPNNPRKPWTDPQRVAFQKSLKEFGDLSGVIRNRRTGHLVGGHKRTDEFKADPDAVIDLTALKKPDKCGTVATGWITTNGTRFSYREVDWPKEKEAAANLAANQHGADFDMSMVEEILKELPTDFDFDLTGFDAATMQSFLQEAGDSTEAARATLAERFGVPPFSVLDARQGYWQDRKRAWLALGIKSEVGRGSTASTSARAADGDIPTNRQRGNAATRQRGNAATRQRGNNQSGRDEEISKSKISPGGSPRPACDYSKKQRGNGSGKAIV